MTPGYQLQPQPQPGMGMAVASLVTGILGLVTFCLWFLAIPLGIIAIILGAVGAGKAKRGEASGGGMAKAGMILGILAVIISASLTIGGLMLAKHGGNYFEQKLKEAEKKAIEDQQKQQNSTQPSSRIPSSADPRFALNSPEVRLNFVAQAHT
jgi:hypothetical protein